MKAAGWGTSRFTRQRLAIAKPFQLNSDTGGKMVSFMASLFDDGLKSAKSLLSLKRASYNQRCWVKLRSDFAAFCGMEDFWLRKYAPSNITDGGAFVTKVVHCS